jgi:hypothetical protein
LELELVETQASSSSEFNTSAAYQKIQPLGKIPAFEGANGFTLSEAIAIAVYGASTCFFFFFELKSLPDSPCILCMMSNFIISYPCQNYTVDNVQL